MYQGFSSMTNHMEEPNALAAKMAHVRCRRIGGRQLREKYKSFSGINDMNGNYMHFENIN